MGRFFRGDGLFSLSLSPYLRYSCTCGPTGTFTFLHFVRRKTKDERLGSEAAAVRPFAGAKRCCWTGASPSGSGAPTVNSRAPGRAFAAPVAPAARSVSAGGRG